MKMNSSPKCNNVLTRCQSSSSGGGGGGGMERTRSASWGSSLTPPIREAASGGVHNGGMAAAASASEEQSKEAEIVPVAPDPQWQQERNVIPDQNYRMEKHQYLEGQLQDLSAMISRLLGPPGPHRVVTGDGRRRCLAFLETETSFLAPLLTALKPNLQHIDSSSWDFLNRGFDTYVHRAIWFLYEFYPSYHLHCFCRRRYSQWYYYNRAIRDFYIRTETPFRWYPHLISFANPDFGLTPQLTEAGEEDPQVVSSGGIPLVGMDRPVKKILRWLKHQGKMESRNLSVMSIVGPVGIGKTTLAVELHARLRQQETNEGCYYFQCNVMVRASRGTDRNILLLQDILSQVSELATVLSSDWSQTKTMEVLVRLVSECLQDKRYFIIIDNILQTSDWKKIKGAFPNANNGSRILFTTRYTSTAEACCSGSYFGLVHEMKPLSEIDSERLLLAKADGFADAFLPDNLKLLCGDILRRCDGIPLFLTTMADWLKEQSLQVQLPQREDEHEEHQKFAIYCEEQVPWLPQRLEQAISSAFNDLDPDSRSLLLYMSMFPFGYKFDKDRLILKWIYEGHLLWGHSHYTADHLETIRAAERLFCRLVDRNVITCVASKCKHKPDEAKACLQWQVNHFMQQFLVSKSAEMGFVFTTATLNLLAFALSGTGHGNEPSSRLPQRLALHYPDPLRPWLLETMDLSQTRSLAVSGAVSGIRLHRFVDLVALDLEGWESLKDGHLVQVCRSKMFFLMYLNIRNTQVSKLPHEIKELRILETLDVSYTQITTLPLEVFELTFLKHLDLRGTRISQLPKQISALHGTLISLLIGDEGTTNSVQTAVTVPHNVRRLRWLDTLATVDLTQHPASVIRALGDLHWLRVLAITWSFHQSTNRDYCEALLSSISKWDCLESLTIHCGLGCSMDFLSSLQKSYALQWLAKFKVIAGRFASVPQWIHWLRRLSFLQITFCNKQTMTDDLQKLGALPRLLCLVLGLDFIPGQSIVIGNEEFRELQRFSLDCPMPCLIFETGAMPKLKYLQLKFCSAPVSQNFCVPSGFSNLHRLTEVALSYNVRYINSPSVKMTVEAVSQQVAEHCNPISLFINGFELDVQEADDEVKENTIGASSRTNAGAEDDAQAVVEEATAEIQSEITEAES